MRTLLVSALALGAFTSAAFAEPLVLSDVQLDALTAGQDVNQSNSTTSTPPSAQATATQARTRATSTRATPPRLRLTLPKAILIARLHREKLKGLPAGSHPGETRLRRESSSGKRCSQVRVNTGTFGECQS